ncbi:MAG TPA: hypothetical protein VGP93_02670, partial [Polyangiaceae bacterium]|nr:hypothetical protein [Polyangiaceae bacterium]
ATDADVVSVKAQAQAMLEAYKGTPYEAEVTAKLNTVLQAAEDGEFSDNEVSVVTEALQGTIDDYQKQDQVDMIYIQDLTSRIREGIQLVSNIVSSSNQTSMSIVGNVGR